MTQHSETRVKLAPAVVPLIVAALTGACSSTGLPLHKNPDKIRAALLTQTPVGTTSDNVVQQLQAHNYSMNRVKTGYVRRTGESSFEEVGVASIKADLGKYYFFPFGTTDVTGYWGFDVDGKLVNIWVTKDGDTP